MLLHRILQLNQGEVAAARLEEHVDDAHPELADLVLLPVEVSAADVAVTDADADVVEVVDAVLCCGKEILRDEAASTELGPAPAPDLNPAHKGKLLRISDYVSVDNFIPGTHTVCQGKN